MPLLTEMSPEILLSYVLRDDRDAYDEAIGRLERLEKCEAALLKARMLLISDGDPDEDNEMIAEIDELLGNAARAALEEK